MVPGQTALKIHGIRRFDWSVGRQFDGGTLHKCTCRHDDIAVVARHRPRFRRHVAVHRRRSLNSLAEGDQCVRIVEGNRLDDVVTALTAVRHNVKAQLFKIFAAKMAPFNAPLTTVGARNSPW